MKTKISWKQSLKAPERPPNATIFPFQLRHVSIHRLKLAEIPPDAMRLIYDTARPENAPSRTT